MTLVLGDNIFYGSGIGKRIAANLDCDGAIIYGYQVKDTSSFGAIKFDGDKIVNIVEKPVNGNSGYAIPGLYHFDTNVYTEVERLKPSPRGELEIVDLINIYRERNKLKVSLLDRGTAWFDTGTVDDMFAASEFVRVIQSKQGMMIGSPEEVAYRNNWINLKELENLANNFKKSQYGIFLMDLIRNQNS